MPGSRQADARLGERGKTRGQLSHRAVPAGLGWLATS
jgi:hypothetical protein